MLPLRHIAFIMDGNGRWASSHGMPRSYGHLQGYRTLQDVCDTCYHHGVSVVSVYALSIDNREKRPAQEIQYLYELLLENLDEFAATLRNNEVTFYWSGCSKGLPDSVVKRLKELEVSSFSSYDRIFNFVFNYSGRQEIVDATRALISSFSVGETFQPQQLSQHCYHDDLGHIDLLIRTGGEQRISDFSLWHIGQTQLVFLDIMWPEISSKMVTQMLTSFRPKATTD
jgi:undecaprenyl diphosphate synthase